jgi:hypothetical protein
MTSGIIWHMGAPSYPIENSGSGFGFLQLRIRNDFARNEDPGQRGVAAIVGLLWNLAFDDRRSGNGEIRGLPAMLLSSQF